MSTLLETARKTSAKSTLSFYYLLFFLSGFPALLYQIVWQRALFTLYGVNVESLTMIVTVFMLGLGLGSLLGGQLSSALYPGRIWGIADLPRIKHMARWVR